MRYIRDKSTVEIIKENINNDCGLDIDLEIFDLLERAEDELLSNDAHPKLATLDNHLIRL